MQRPPPLSACLYFPITAGVAALAIVATLQWHSGANVGRFMFAYDDWWREPWRLATPVLFHVNTLHLLFNLMMLWVFGTQIEGGLGSGRTLGIYLLLAVGSTAAEEALFSGGVGLSGVVYGQFGLLWVLGRSDRRFLGAIDRQTARAMVGWFFLCIVLTVTDVLPVANAAHGSGFVLGALLGWTMAARGALRRFRNGAVLTVVFLLCLAGGTVARPYVNFTTDVGPQLAINGAQALENDDPQRAVAQFERAVNVDPNQESWWFALGIAYQRVGRADDALRAFQRALELDPGNVEYQRAVAHAKLRRTARKPDGE